MADAIVSEEMAAMMSFFAVVTFSLAESLAL
jgi:hypothetical protein